MTFLADMGVLMTTVSALRQLGHNVVHLREQGLIRMEDPGIVAKARSEGRIVLTFDPTSARSWRFPKPRVPR